MSGKKRNSKDNDDISTMNGIDEEEIKHEDCVSLDDLFQSCSRITVASLAFPKLSVVMDKSVVADLHLVHKADTAGFNMENNIETDEVLILHELKINRWLEAQIDEYQATLSRRKYQKQQRYEDQQQLLRINSTSFSDKGRFSNEKGGISKPPKIAKATSSATAATGNDTDINVGKINLCEERGPSSLLSFADDCESQYPVKRMKQQQQPNRSERELKDELLDITLQRYRESSLLTRIHMSQASMNTSFPHHAAVDNLDVDTSSEDPSSTSITKYSSMDSSFDHGFQLRKQALSARDFMVLSTLKTTKLLDQSRKALNDLMQQVLVVQQENRDLWKELNYWVRQRQQQEEEYSRSCRTRYGVDTDAEQQHHEVANMLKEIDSIENILIHTICGSGIDWYEDSRLRQVLDRLQQAQMERNKM